MYPRYLLSLALSGSDSPQEAFDKLCHGLITVHLLAFLKNLLLKDHRAEGVDGLLEVLQLGQTVKMKKSVLFHSPFFFPAKPIIVATPAISMLSSGWSTTDPCQLHGRRL